MPYGTRKCLDSDESRTEDGNDAKREPSNSALQLPSAYPARLRHLRGLHPRGGFKVKSAAMVRMTAAVALAAERQGR